ALAARLDIRMRRASPLAVLLAGPFPLRDLDVERGRERGSLEVAVEGPRVRGVDDDAVDVVAAWAPEVEAAAGFGAVAGVLRDRDRVCHGAQDPVAQEAVPVGRLD